MIVTAAIDKRIKLTAAYMMLACTSVRGAPFQPQLKHVNSTTPLDALRQMKTTHTTSRSDDVTSLTSHATTNIDEVTTWIPITPDNVTVITNMNQHPLIIDEVTTQPNTDKTASTTDDVTTQPNTDKTASTTDDVKTGYNQITATLVDVVTPQSDSTPMHDVPSPDIDPWLLFCAHPGSSSGTIIVPTEKPTDIISRYIIKAKEVKDMVNTLKVRTANERIQDVTLLRELDESPSFPGFPTSESTPTGNQVGKMFAHAYGAVSILLFYYKQLRDDENLHHNGAYATSMSHVLIKNCDLLTELKLGLRSTNVTIDNYATHGDIPQYIRDYQNLAFLANRNYIVYRDTIHLFEFYIQKFSQ